jgi:hypothetical protein
MSSPAPTILTFPIPSSILCVEGDPTQWGLLERVITGLTDGEPVTLGVVTPLAGTLLLAPRRAGSFSLYPLPPAGGWVPCVKLPAPYLYLPSTTGLAAHSPGYMLAPGTSLETLQQDIMTAMRDGTLLPPVSATIDGHAGTVILNGAFLPFVVLVDAEPATQRDGEELPAAGAGD